MVNCAFLVGCSKYRAEEFSGHKLEGVTFDIINMKNALLQYCDCADKNIIVIDDTEDTAPNPTSGGICNTIKQKATEYSNTEINNLFFYYSGHGFITNKKGPVLIPVDTILTPIELGTLPLATIVELLQKSFHSVKHIILILDMCLSSDPYAKGIADEKMAIDIDYLPKGFVVFHSCFPEQTAYIIPPKHEAELGKGSAFTCTFIDALKEPHCCTVRDIDTYIKQRIKHYNSTLGRDQKPFTSFQDSSVYEVAIKMQSLTLPEGLSIEEFQEYKHANTMNAQLNDAQVMDVIQFAKSIDLTNSTVITVMGEASLNRMNLLCNQYHTFNNSFTFDDYNWSKIFFDEVRTKIKKKSLIKDSLEDKRIEHSITRICNSINDGITHFMMDNCGLDKMISAIGVCRLELSMYIIAINIVVNRQPDFDTALLQHKKNFLQEYCTLSDKSIAKTREKIESRHIAVQYLNDYLRKIKVISNQLYKDKYSHYYHTRYNSASFSEISDLIEQIHQLALSDF